MKLFFGHCLKWFEAIDSGVVNQNIDLAECFLCRGEEPLHFRLLCDTRLHRNCFAAAFCNFINHTIGIFFGRRIIDDDSRTFGCELFCNPSPIPFDAPVTIATFPANFWLFIVVPSTQFLLLEIR